MFAGFLKFNTLPEIGFALHFSAEKYENTYAKQEKSFEIVYIKSGEILAEFNGEKITIPEGSVFVLFRQLPITLTAANNIPQSHCTVQAAFDYEFTLLSDEVQESWTDGLLLPFVTLPCAETEEIRKKLYAIVSAIGVSREQNRFSASLTFLEIMRTIDNLARKKQNLSAASAISNRIKKYIAANIGEVITLSDIAASLQRTPNYLNAVFKEANSITINRYIGREKVRRIAELMQTQKLSFQSACENAAIMDVSYGYRLFKKHMGMTPGTFLAGEKLRKE